MSLTGIDKYRDYINESEFENYLHKAHNFDTDIKIKEERDFVFTSVDGAGKPVVIKFYYGEDVLDDYVVVVDGKTVDTVKNNPFGLLRIQSDINDSENEYYKLLYDRYVFMEEALKSTYSKEKKINLPEKKEDIRRGKYSRH